MIPIIDALGSGQSAKRITTAAGSLIADRADIRMAIDISKIKGRRKLLGKGNPAGEKNSQQTKYVFSALVPLYGFLFMLAISHFIAPKGLA